MPINKMNEKVQLLEVDHKFTYTAVRISCICYCLTKNVPNYMVYATHMPLAVHVGA